MRAKTADPEYLGRIRRLLRGRRDLVRPSLQACAHCSLCAESCFKFRESGGDPTFMPSYKAIHSIGRIWRSRGKLGDEQYEEIRKLAWDKCVLCMRCSCPIGVSVPSLIALARSACRERGLWREYASRRNA